MALRSGYKGFKKLLPGLKIIRPGTLGIDNTELSKTFFPRSEQAVLGAKNLCPNNATTKTDGDVTFTVNSDGSVTLNGTASATVGFELKTYGRWLKAGVRYILNGCTGGSDSTYKLSVNRSTGDLAKCLDGDVEFTVDNTFDYRVWIVVFSGTQFNNLTIYPMIRLASDSDDTYVPYAMTNRELTDVKESSVQLNEGITVNTERGGNHLYKKGNIVQMVLTIEGVTANAYSTFATVPEGFRPIALCTGLPTLRSAHTIIIQKTGGIQSSDALNNANVDIYGVWIV